MFILGVPVSFNADSCWKFLQYVDSNTQNLSFVVKFSVAWNIAELGYKMFAPPPEHEDQQLLPLYSTRKVAYNEFNLDHVKWLLWNTGINVFYIYFWKHFAVLNGIYAIGALVGIGSSVLCKKRNRN